MSLAIFDTKSAFLRWHSAQENCTKDRRRFSGINVNIAVHVDDICAVESEVESKSMIVQLKKHDFKTPSEHQEK